MVRSKKKLIEVALPLEAINKAAAYEKMPGIGPHPRGLHLWWARRPLAAARAVIFAQLVDDPSANPDLFPTEKSQEKERKRLFSILEDLVQWESTNNERVLDRARAEIWQSWRRACAENVEHPKAKELFDREKLPGFHDPFAGGGALPLEAQRLGLDACASDLNPVAVLINKAMVEIPTRFAGQPPVNPKTRSEGTLIAQEWKGAQGLAEDVTYYGQWLRDEAQKRIGHLYPRARVTQEMVRDRPDLRRYEGQELPIIAWLWARTVKSPNPAYAHVDVPLVSSFMLASKKGKEVYLDPAVDDDTYSFRVRVGRPPDVAATKAGTKLGRGASFRCLMSGAPIDGDYIKEEAKAGRMGTRLMAMVAEGSRSRLYLDPLSEHEDAARRAAPQWRPDVEFLQQALGFRIGNYGMSVWSDLFTPRQLVALSTLSDLVQEARDRVLQDTNAEASSEDTQALHSGGRGAYAYAEAISVYLAFAVDRCADFSNSCTRWVPGNQKVMNLFGKQAIAMTWDFPEAAVLHDTVGGFAPAATFIASCLNKLPLEGRGTATQQDAMATRLSAGRLVSTDPPYYDNIGYADLSDFFYVWLRRSLRSTFPDLFSTVAVPKTEELVATPHRHGGREQAENFFMSGMGKAMQRLSEQAHPAFPVTVYYAFKQAETDSDAGITSTGWETFLDAVIHAGFAVTGTWPLRSEQEYRMRGLTSNALASSIVLVCRPRPAEAPTTSRREFLAALKSELPEALLQLQRSNIAPVDLAQASIGPGMAIYTRYARVLESDGSPLTVRVALALINQVLDEKLAEQEGDFDADTRWALAWFAQSGFSDGEYGVAETLSKAKNTSVSGLVDAGILKSKGGKVRLLEPNELPEDWDPEDDSRLTVWEMVHHLIRRLETGGEGDAAELVAKLGAQAETARELAYRLYSVCESKKRANLALAYNGLVQSWPEISRLAREGVKKAGQASLFGEGED